VSKFTWGDTVKVVDNAPPTAKPGSIVSIVGVHDGASRSGEYFDRFPEGTVYSIEYDDGSSIEVPESAIAAYVDVEESLVDGLT
jgi:hypothetical protein